MCTRHWRFYYAAARAKGNENKSFEEIIKLAQKKEEAVNQKIQKRKAARDAQKDTWATGGQNVLAGQNA